MFRLDVTGIQGENFSPVVREYAGERGAPATPGRTTIKVDGRKPVATTESDGVPVIRTTARIGHTGEAVNRGQLRYITEVGGQKVSGVYPFVAEPVDPFEVVSLEFLEPDHSVYALRPADPLQIVWGFYPPVVVHLSGRRIGDDLKGARGRKSHRR